VKEMARKLAAQEQLSNTLVSAQKAADDDRYQSIPTSLSLNFIDPESASLCPRCDLAQRALHA
jgi:hypothetical protein